MAHKKATKEDNATLASVAKEMATPRTARSARIGTLNLDSTRDSEQPSIIKSGTVARISPSPRPSQPEKALIAVDGSDRRPQGLRIENDLTNEHGDEVKVKKGAQVEVTITAEPKSDSR